MSPYYPPHNCSAGAALSRFSHLRSEGHIPASADALSMQLEARHVDWDNLPPPFLYISSSPSLLLFLLFHSRAAGNHRGGFAPAKSFVFACSLPVLLLLLFSMPESRDFEIPALWREMPRAGIWKVIHRQHNRKLYGQKRRRRLWTGRTPGCRRQ